MRLSPAEIADLPGGTLKAFMNGMQREAKLPEPPTFKVKGPMMFPTRVRRAQRNSMSTQVNYTYMGGETFRLASVYKTQHTDGSGDVTIGVSLSPVDLNLVSEVSGSTMTLADAAERFDGFEGWLSAVRPVGDELPPAASAITKADVSEAWGAW